MDPAILTEHDFNEPGAGGAVVDASSVANSSGRLRSAVGAGIFVYQISPNVTLLFVPKRK